MSYRIHLKALSILPTFLALPLLAMASVQNSILSAENDPRRGEQELRYLGVLFGPRMDEWSSTQADGQTPISVRNFLTWNYRLNDGWRFGVTGSWSWRPVQGQDLALRDPFLKLAKPNLIRSGELGWYSDIRLHMPITSRSRNRDLWWGLQSFNSLEWTGTWGAAGIYASARYNQYGAQGTGDEWEFYVAPHLEWQATEKLTFGTLLEWGGGMPFLRETDIVFSDGISLQPGFNWEISSGLSWGPYVLIPLVSDTPSSASSTDSNTRTTAQTTFGATLSWKIDTWK
jgi:hypothetical protein